MDRKKIIKIIKDDAVHWGVILFIGILMVLNEYNFALPFYRDVMKMGDLSPYLSGGLPVLYLITAKICALQLVRNNYLAFALGLLIFLGIMGGISFVGQEEASKIQDFNLDDLLSDEDIVEDDDTSQSNRHYLIVSLGTLLFGLALWIDYFFTKAHEAVKNTKQSMQLNEELRSLETQIEIEEGEYNRAQKEPEKTARCNVHDRMELRNNEFVECENKIRDLEAQLEGDQKYLELLHKQVVVAATAVFNRKPHGFGGKLKKLFT
ncbi:MAG: hypothetical protein JXR03_18460 [Cyclobacteriaceae bacterium]